MAQAEDTELRDLVIEALEKNGSLAKIRALLRANIFLAFEDESDNIKQNINLDNILKLPEGLIALSIVHEFLEFCNLKNTLFVYRSESRQNRDFTYEGRKALSERLRFLNGNQNTKEPILVTLINSVLSTYQRTYYEPDGVVSIDKQDLTTMNNQKDDENCTYIVHEDSSTSTSNSNSDNSSDEKNKLHLKLPMDNSDTDTSSDSARDKTHSEYIANEHILMQDHNFHMIVEHSSCFSKQKENNLADCKSHNENATPAYFLHEMKTIANAITSSDSTSYIDIKSIKLDHGASKPKTIDENTGFNNQDKSDPNSVANKQNASLKQDSVSSATLSSISSLSLMHDNYVNKGVKSSPTNQEDQVKSDAETADYSLDFISSPASKNKSANDTQISPSDHDNISMKLKNSQIESPKQNSQSSQSSVSISDVADLIEYSEKTYSFNQSSKDIVMDDQSKTNLPVNVPVNESKLLSEDSGDFSESPIPSLSNLSLEVHSD